MKTRPNILLILADQQRYDCIGYSGQYPVKTPNIDRLASEGMWFENAFSPIPVCCPARQSMLHGRRAETFGALWNYNNGLPVASLDPEAYTWVKDLQNNGYRTGHVGKWSIHPTYKPDRYGFDDHVGDSDYNAFRKAKYPDVQYVNGYFGEKDPIPLEDARTHWLAKQAIELIEKYEEEGVPWLMSIDFPEPHLPCRPAGKFAEMYKPEEIPPWGSFADTFEGKPYIQKQQLYSWKIENFSWEDWAPIVARYYGVVSQVDDAIGRITDALEKMNVMDDTIIIFTSDHGDMCGGHRMIDKHYVLYEDNVKVPLLIRWPKGVRSGRCSDLICHSLDLPPTILDLLDLPLHDFLQGRSMRPFLEGKQVDDWRTEVVSTYNGQQFGLYTQRMIRNRKWKYIWNTTDVDELYNLEEDPHELHNLIYDESLKDLVQELRRKLYEQLIKDEDGLVVGNEWMKTQLYHGRKI
ncbi:MAG: sulfatase-like hydrolase/transferase [Clostridia bacterium]|jgi:arylsulfatase A-like enzyme